MELARIAQLERALEVFFFCFRSDLCDRLGTSGRGLTVFVIMCVSPFAYRIARSLRSRTGTIE